MFNPFGLIAMEYSSHAEGIAEILMISGNESRRKIQIYEDSLETGFSGVWAF